MMRRFLSLVLVLSAFGTASAAALAEDKPAEPAVATDEAKPAPAADEAKPAACDDVKFPWFSLAPKVGFAYFGEGSFSQNINGVPVTSTIKSRSGARIALDLAMGGDGFAFEISPLFIHESGSGFSSNTVGADITFLWRLQFGRWFPHFGLGMQAGYMLSDNLDIGLELYSRVPLGVTWYVLKNLGVVAELGIGYGATGMKMKATGAMPAGDLKFAQNVLVDFSVGIRWP